MSSKNQRMMTLQQGMRRHAFGAHVSLVRCRLVEGTSHRYIEQQMPQFFREHAIFSTPLRAPVLLIMFVFFSSSSLVFVDSNY